MANSNRATLQCILLVASLTAVVDRWSLGAPLPMLTSHATHLVDPSGREVVLKGCNLGNGLILESWMFGGTLKIDGEAFQDGMQVYHTLSGRFGQGEADQLMATYRQSWITPRNFQRIKSFGFNLVRLPFDYRQLQSDQPPYSMKADGFRWIDQTLAMAEEAGVYVILDLHGVPGGQSNADHTGEAGQNKFWTSEVDQQRTIDLWRALAERYKDRSVVSGYDLINEPYGDHHTDERPKLAALMPKICDAIRSAGDKHVVYFDAGLNTGIDFYGNPHARGMTNVGFTEHYYPGLFGGKPSLEIQARLLNQEMPTKAEYLRRLQVPYLVGEFNVVFQSENANRVMREYYDRLASYGWAGTMWSYKAVKKHGGSAPSGWYMVTNAQPLPPIDLATATNEQVKSFFAGMATMPLATNERLLTALTTATSSRLYLPTFPTPSSTLPATPQSNPAGYTSIDIGHATMGHTATQADGGVCITASGADINGVADACRFTSRRVEGPSVELRATIASFADTHERAKAGVMARWGTDKEVSKGGAAMAMISLFPDGTVGLLSRAAAGAKTTEQRGISCVTLPVELRLRVDAGRVTGAYRTGAGQWEPVGSANAPSNDPLRMGLAVCSHHSSVLTTVKAYLDDKADAALALAAKSTREEPSLLTNGAFQKQGDAVEQAAGEVDQQPAPSVESEPGSHHELIGKSGSSSLWQEVSAEPGKRYTFSVSLQNGQGDPAAAEHHDAATVELRLESTTSEGQVILNTRTVDVAKLATGSTWSRLCVSGTAQTEKLRALVVIKGGSSPRVDAVKMDKATLTPAHDGK